MFRASKSPRRPSNTGPTFSKEGVGAAGTMISGNSAAWTRSFEFDHFAGKSKTGKQSSTEDLLANVDRDLLNPTVDEEAWNASWYVAKVSNTAVMRALQHQPDGAFVIRDSSSEAGSFAMAYRFQGETHHVLIHGREQGLVLAKSDELLSCLSELVARYSAHYDAETDQAFLACPLDPAVALKIKSNEDNEGGPAEDGQDSSAMLTRGDGQGNLIAMDATTGATVAAAAPQVPSRRGKASIRDELTRSTPASDAAARRQPAELEQGVSAKAGVMLCPNCSAKQSVKNKICSSCNGRLFDERDHMPPHEGASDVEIYGTVIPKTRKPTGKPQRPEDLDQLLEAGDDYDRIAIGEDGAPEQADATTGRLADDAAGKKKKKKPTKSQDPIEVVVAPPPANLKGILCGDDYVQSGCSVVFSDKNIIDSVKESLLARGICCRLDPLSYHTGFYHVEGIERREQAADKLHGLPSGTFVIYLDRDQEEQMILSYVAASGNVGHANVRHDLDGVFLELGESASSQPRFKYISELVGFYISGEAKPPHLLRLNEEQIQIFRSFATEGGGFTVATQSAGEEHIRQQQTNKQRGHHGPYIKAQHVDQELAAAGDHTAGEATSPTEKPAEVSDSLADQPWYKGDLSRAEAVALIEFEPSGSFVIRNNVDEVGQYILTYVIDGTLHHHEIVNDGGKFALAEGRGYAFETLPGLVAFYAGEEGTEAGHLECRLRPPRSATLSSASTAQPHNGERPAWLRTNLPKANALQVIAGKPDGAFVIRSSESRTDCYVLSYIFRGQVHHELVRVVGDDKKTFFLNNAPHHSFHSLQNLIEFFESPRAELKYPLQPTLVNTEEGILRRSSSGRSRNSQRSSTRSVPGSPASPQAPSPQASPRAVGSAGQAPPPPMLRKASSRTLLTSPGEMPGHSPSRAASRRSAPSHHAAGSVGNRLDQRAVISNWCCLSLTPQEALARLPQKEGAFIIRRSQDYFATLTMVANGKHFHAQIEDTTQGLRLKKSASFQPNLSALVAFYKISTQTDLPRPLISW